MIRVFLVAVNLEARLLPVVNVVARRKLTCSSELGVDAIIDKVRWEAKDGEQSKLEIWKYQWF